MRALIQRVRRASVTVDGQIVGSCGHGLLVLLGVGQHDDEAGKTNLSLLDVGGEALVVSQFTLYANCKRGRRPSFTEAGEPGRANELYEHFCDLVENDLGEEHVGRGVFGAMMDVELVNDGPFTIWLDTDEL